MLDYCRALDVKNFPVTQGPHSGIFVNQPIVVIVHTFTGSCQKFSRVGVWTTIDFAIVTACRTFTPNLTCTALRAERYKRHHAWRRGCRRHRRLLRSCWIRGKNENKDRQYGPGCSLQCNSCNSATYSARKRDRRNPAGCEDSLPRQVSDPRLLYSRHYHRRHVAHTIHFRRRRHCRSSPRSSRRRYRPRRSVGS